MAEEKGFTIKDRRLFSDQDSGEKKEQERPEPGKDEAQAQAGRDKASDARAPEQAEEPDHALPEVNFATFVVSLSSSVLVALGEVEDPATGQRTPHRQMAKHTIDILGLLEEKTRGNLTPDEENLLKNMLYDLRMRYVRHRW